MFVIPKSQRNRVETARKNFERDMVPYTEKRMKLQQDKLKKDITDALKKNEPVEIYNMLQELLDEFLDPASVLYFKNILCMSYKKMIPYWQNVFLKSRPMEKIYDYFGLDPKESLEGMPTRNTFSHKHPKRAEYFRMLVFFDDCFDYEGFSNKSNTGRYDAFALCKDLDITVCLYCNINYIYTVESTTMKTDKKGNTKQVTMKELRPALDHFFPKSEFPIFRLSFENLIPSCSICNSGIKKTNVMTVDKYLHPYQDVMPEIVYTLDSNNDLLICAGPHQDKDLQNKIDKTIEDSKTKLLYDCFQTQVNELVELGKIYTEEYVDELKEFLFSEDNSKRSVQQIRKDILGYVPKDKMYNTSLGELKHQIVSRLLKGSANSDIWKKDFEYEIPASDKK